MAVHPSFSLCLLTQAKSDRTELWCGKPWAISNEDSLWGVATLAWGIQISLPSSHWPSQIGIPLQRMETDHRLARWALFFTRFQFTVTYLPGFKNTKADALARQFELTLQPLSPDPILPTTLIVAPVQWDVMTEIAETQGTDPILTECPPNRIFVPPSLRTQVIQQVHDLPSSGHLGITASIQLLSN